MPTPTGFRVLCLGLCIPTLLLSCTKKAKSEQNSFAFTNDKTQQLVLTHIAEFAFPWAKLVRKDLQDTPAFKAAMLKKWRRVCFLHSELGLDQVKKLEDSRIFDIQTERIDLENLAVDSVKEDKKITDEDVKKVTEALNKSIFDEIKHDSAALYRNHMVTAQVVSNEAVNLPLFEKFMKLSEIRAQQSVAKASAGLERKRSSADKSDQITLFTMYGLAAALPLLYFPGLTVALSTLAPGILVAQVGMLGWTKISQARAHLSAKVLQSANSKKIKVDEISISLLNRASIAEEAKTGKIIETKEIIDPNNPAKDLDLKKEISALISDFKSWVASQPGASVATEKAIGLALGQSPSHIYSVEDATKIFDNLATMNAPHVACPAERSSYSYPWLKSIDPDGDFVFADPVVGLF